MRRICCFCESWESGGIESFLHNILLRMDLTGLEVDIVAAQLKDSVFTQALRERGVRFQDSQAASGICRRTTGALRLCCGSGAMTWST